MSTKLLKLANPVLGIMHGTKNEQDFPQEKLQKMNRLMDNLLLGQDDAREFYQIAAMITDAEHGETDPLFNEIVIINALYQMGIEEGKRLERQKKKAANCN